MDADSLKQAIVDTQVKYLGPGSPATRPNPMETRNRSTEEIRKRDGTVLGIATPTKRKPLGSNSAMHREAWSEPSLSAGVLHPHDVYGSGSRGGLRRWDIDVRQRSVDIHRVRSARWIRHSRSEQTAMKPGSAWWPPTQQCEADTSYELWSLQGVFQAVLCRLLHRGAVLDEVADLQFVLCGIEFIWRNNGPGRWLRLRGASIRR